MRAKVDRVPAVIGADFKLVFTGEILGSEIASLKRTEADKEMAAVLCNKDARPPASYLLMAIAVMFLRAEEARAKAAADEAVRTARGNDG